MRIWVGVSCRSKYQEHYERVISDEDYADIFYEALGVLPHRDNSQLLPS